MKPESEKGLYSRSFRDERDAETSASRPLMVIEVEPVTRIYRREVAVREIVIRSPSVIGERSESLNIFNLVIREKSSRRTCCVMCG